MRILVIEDTEKHLDDARKYSETLIGCTVDFATNLAEAMELLEKNNYDGAISDVLFPSYAGSSYCPVDNAIYISEKLVEKGVHHVFNTAGNHHGRNYHRFVWKTPRATYAGSLEVGGIDCYDFRTTGMVIESYPEEDYHSDKDTKQWQAAFRYILLAHALLQLPDKGLSVILERDPNLKGFPYGDYGRLTERFENCSHPFVVEVFKKYNA